MKRRIWSLVGVWLLALLPMMAVERDSLQLPADQSKIAQSKTDQNKTAADSSWMKTLFNSTMFKGNSEDSLTRARHEKTFFHRLGKTFTNFFREFSNIDERYIEPQHYNYTVMLQNTNTYEVYTLYGEEGQRISFAPDPSWRLGPYLGWRWVFLGYTVDLKHINIKSDHSSKKEFNLSLYSSLLGVDLFWRQTGNDYHIQRMDLGNDVNTDALKKVSFDGFKGSIKGLNLYYIFNHRKFSYPAAYSQSTKQKLSAGSWMVGLGYTQHQLEVDWDKLSNIVDERLNQKSRNQLNLENMNQLNQEARNQMEARIDSSLMFSKVRYSDYSATVGYGYNWVFAKNWLFNASLSVGLAYNHSRSDDPELDKFNLKNFNFKNFNIDGVGRFGVVWNNDKWYAGVSTVIHSYNYHKDHFSTNNSFGSLNIYVGVNFGKKREYKNVKQ